MAAGPLSTTQVGKQHVMAPSTSPSPPNLNMAPPSEPAATASEGARGRRGRPNGYKFTPAEPLEPPAASPLQKETAGEIACSAVDAGDPVYPAGGAGEVLSPGKLPPAELRGYGEGKGGLLCASSSVVGVQEGPCQLGVQLNAKGEAAACGLGEANLLPPPL